MRYDQVIKQLHQAYDQKVEERDQKGVAPWKEAVRASFLQQLQAEGGQTLLEIGAGTGVHGQYFQDNGLQVVCTDLSPKMVARCREKGLTAYVRDFLSLDFPAGSFDAVFALNCLLHVPRLDLPKVLQMIKEVIRPGGLFYWGQYGGIAQEGPYPDDHYEPKRFFSLLPDEAIKKVAAQFFELENFEPILPGNGDDLHFQSMILRRR